MVKIATSAKGLAKSPRNGKTKTASYSPPAAAGAAFAGPDVTIHGVSIDLDGRKLPKAIDDGAFESGGFPYPDKMKRKRYERELYGLQIELLKMQSWARANGARVVVLFEGRDSAGKGGSIHRVTQHLNPRYVRVAALNKPTETERGQWYFQRYVAHLPTAGEAVLFDRSWYNRAGVEPVMGFCTPDETTSFLEEVPSFEQMLVANGTIFIKLWLTIGREMQITRLFARRHDPLKRWKLSEIDYLGLPRWDDYTKAAERMLRATHTPHAPWTIIRANDKRRARLAVIRSILARVPYADKNMKAVGDLDPRIVAPADIFLAAGGQP